MLSLQEKTAERSPPDSAPEGTAITSASRPASSRLRWAFSLPAQSSMQPKGRATEVLHSTVCGSTFLNFICGSCLRAGDRRYRVLRDLLFYFRCTLLDTRDSISIHGFGGTFGGGF